MKKNMLLFLGVFLALTGCSTSSSSSESSPSDSESSSLDSSSSSEVVMKESRLHIYSVPEGVNKYQGASLFVGETPIDLMAVKVNLSQSWDGLAPNRVDNGVAIFRLEGKATFTLKCNYTLYETFTTIRPKAAGITPVFNLEENSFSFTLSNTGTYTLEPNGDRSKTIHLFVNSLEEDGIDKNADNVLYFGPGLHTSANDPRLIGDSIVPLESHTIVYLDYGAVVRGRFEAYNKTDIQIVGGGVIDGSTFSRIAGQSSGNTAFIPIDFGYCTNIVFKDFSILDPAGWTVNWYFTSDSSIDNINIMTSRSNGDGISLQSCQSIQVSNVFVRSWDDSLVVKNYPQWSNRSLHGTTRNITFSDCVLWTDLAQSMEIGYETVGQVLEDVSFEDITVLHAFHKPVMSIHNANNADIKRVNYKNITVEAASMGGGDAGTNKQLIQFNIAWSANWSDSHTTTALGSIDTVSVENVLVLDGNNNIPMEVAGCVDTRSAYYGTTHYVRNVAIKNVQIKSQRLTSDYPYLTTNTYTENITLTDDQGAITGAEYSRAWSESELSQYQDFVTVYIN